MGLKIVPIIFQIIKKLLPEISQNKASVRVPKKLCYFNVPSMVQSNRSLKEELSSLADTMNFRHRKSH
jgi:hypothetical protein